MLDRVTRKCQVAGDTATVWAALTEPAQVAQWFGDTAEIDLRVGGAVRFTWPAGEVSHGVITRLEPGVSLAYRWDVFGTIVEPQLFPTVELTVAEAAEGGSTVTVVETGLALVSAAGVSPDLQALHDEHVDGWRNEMRDLIGYLAARAGTTSSARTPPEHRTRPSAPLDVTSTTPRSPAR